MPGVSQGGEIPEHVEEVASIAQGIDQGCVVAAGGVDARFDRYRLQGGVYALLTGQATGREVARIEFVFAAAGETRTITDVAGVVAEVRAALTPVPLEGS